MSPARQGQREVTRRHARGCERERVCVRKRERESELDEPGSNWARHLSTVRRKLHRTNLTSIWSTKLALQEGCAVSPAKPHSRHPTGGNN